LLQISLHYILSFTHQGYGQATSLNRIKDQIIGPNPPYKNQSPEDYYRPPPTTPPARKANASIVMLARNGDLNGIITSVKQMEDRFNKKFQYPYVFLNEEPFTDNFKKSFPLLLGG
jgi:alpha 1,2-mannosyltransferase